MRLGVRVHRMAVPTRPRRGPHVAVLGAVQHLLGVQMALALDGTEKPGSWPAADA